jgi:hypothetical protein
MRAMAVQAQIRAVLAGEPRDDSSATLAFELDEMPGAVWRTELESLMPSEMRVSLLERGGQKYAVVTFPAGEEQRAQAAFSEALRGANEVSSEAHASVARARAARQRAALEEPAADPHGEEA